MTDADTGEHCLFATRHTSPQLNYNCRIKRINFALIGACYVRAPSFGPSYPHTRTKNLRTPWNLHVNGFGISGLDLHLVTVISKDLVLKDQRHAMKRYEMQISSPLISVLAGMIGTDHGFMCREPVFLSWTTVI